MDKIYAMKLFVRVAERESFSRAAEDIGLPKGSVSRQIQALEHQLGIRLLHRTTRRVQLTQDGMVYYERAKDLLSNLDELEGLFQPDPASISGKIRVDIPPGLANSLIMPRLLTFCISIPALRWNFVVAIDRSIYYGKISTVWCAQSRYMRQGY